MRHCSSVLNSLGAGRPGCWVSVGRKPFWLLRMQLPRLRGLKGGLPIVWQDQLHGFPWIGPVDWLEALNIVKALHVHWPKNPWNWAAGELEWDSDRKLRPLSKMEYWNKCKQTAEKCTMLQKFSKCEVKAALCGNFKILLPLKFDVLLVVLNFDFSEFEAFSQVSNLPNFKVQIFWNGKMGIFEI